MTLFSSTVCLGLARHDLRHLSSIMCVLLCEGLFDDLGLGAVAALC